jgi:hypothetical protein
MTLSALRRIAAACALSLAAPGLAHAQSDDDVAAMVAAWASSPHADADAEAFVHWNGEGEIPAQCAVCHSTAGFLDFHGLNGTPAGTVDNKVATGGVIDCDSCHAEGVAGISEVAFPSGITLPALEKSASCMTCHQGRSSGPTVAASTQGMDPDTVNPDLSFTNPHYLAAAATNFGTEAKGLYEYPGQSYTGRFSHVAEASTCVSCHNPHSLEVRAEDCAVCHGTDDPTNIRTTTTDFDGDGDTTEGIAAEVVAMQETLAQAIATYGETVAGTPIAYSATSYPYFFVDLNGNGTADPDEARRDNGYKAWTPRLLEAAYNYQFVSKDPGSYAHNARYALQALYDSIADLASASDFEMPPLVRP